MKNMMFVPGTAVFDKCLISIYLKVSTAIRTVRNMPQQDNECHENSRVKTVHKFISVHVSNNIRLCAT